MKNKTKLHLLLADDDIDALIKGVIDRNVEESSRRVKNFKLGLIESLEKNENVQFRFKHAYAIVFGIKICISFHDTIAILLNNPKLQYQHVVEGKFL